ncbi:MAG: molybdopterin-guanine dinucleotide biosynthesis protein B [Coriobacteriia bacterium]|nr:molybdopterin-guanine dinucleotide biosynthesis protein B [Coriobacteriia bacterium]
MVNIPSPALAIVGRHNSGKTTLVVKLIAQLVARGFDVGSVKHHHRTGFDIDIPGKDSYRQREAGASETVISAPGQIARIASIEGEAECDAIVRSMPGHDIVLVEGYRKSGLPTIEIMREGNNADSIVAEVLLEGAKRGWPLGADFTQIVRALRDIDSEEERRRVLRETGEAMIFANVKDVLDRHQEVSEARRRAQDPHSIAVDDKGLKDVRAKMPHANTVAIVTNIPAAQEAAKLYGLPCFDINDVDGITDFVVEHYVRPRVSVVIQAGGESRRMGQSKATVPFAGKPLICRLVHRLHVAADELIITTNEPEKLSFLADEFPELDIKLVKDAFELRGALPGLYTALNAASSPYVAVVACDMVNASAALVVAESIAMNEKNCDVVVPVNKHGFEPFHALYRRETCLEPIRASVLQGERRVQAFYEHAVVYEFTQEEVSRAVPYGGCFVNCNTPEELAALERALTE